MSGIKPDLQVYASRFICLVSPRPKPRCGRVSALPPAPLAPLPGSPDPDAVLDAFLKAMAARGLTLYPEQEEAILELFAGRNVVLNTPTGSGKSLVAAAFHFKARVGPTR